ncbi:hypothetical protein HOT99_gp114 [Caulobacter phage CcrBL10]|uniref:Uncharacterized protein n=1 Tax=Caulobacter phage CcrBL10 TaxID=2283269 RepID=A0A385E9M3_9CAUD|nr:hypothetical protein HOT99_gp114 [Caulobacter phage CcrBL10]AXQ68503.1 hypothetical protein CcrBL10_gp299 [Caulobacter phage CcrBL10]
MPKLWNKPVPLKAQPIPYQIERYLLDHRDVRLVRGRDGWFRLQGRTGVNHFSRVPGSGRYSARTALQCVDSLCTIESYDDRNRPDIIGLHRDVI